MRTPQPQLEIASYRPQLDVLLSEENSRVMGSIGRMVLCSQWLEDPYAEFDLRDAMGFENVRRVDIDILGASTEAVEAARAIGPYTVDTQAFSDSDMAVYHDGTHWVLQSAEVDFEAKLSDEFMAPVKATIDGVTIVTIPLTSHMLLHRARRRDSEKDLVTDLVIDKMMDKQGLNGIRSGVPTPFRVLKALLLARPIDESERHSRHSDDS